MAGQVPGAQATTPVLDGPATAPVDLQEAVIVQATLELAGVGREPVLPAGLVPTIPLLLTFVVIDARAGELGPFRVAEARLSCRSGVRARALLAASAVDAPPDLAATLARSWGLAGDGPVRVQRRYDRTRVEVPAWGLELAVVDPAPIGTGDVQYVTGLHPVTSADGRTRLAQVELDVALERVERGRPQVERYDGLEIAGRCLHPATPVAATIGVGTVTLPRLRFLLDPDVPPHLGTEVLASPTTE